jgi:hypothetical protein
LSLISAAQQRRLVGGAVILLAVALFGLAAKAKTSHYSPDSSSSAYFSSSVKISYKPLTLFSLLPAASLPNLGLLPAMIIFLRPVVFAPVVRRSSEVLAWLNPLRAPPASLLPPF